MSINADQDKASWRTDEEVMSLYEEWLVKNGKVYNALEKKKRFQIFKDNLRCIDKINAENRGYTSGLNAFSDMTYEEFRTSMLMFQKDASVRQILLRLFNLSCRSIRNICFSCFVR